MNILKQLVFIAALGTITIAPQAAEHNFSEQHLFEYLGENLTNSTFSSLLDFNPNEAFCTEKLIAFLKQSSLSIPPADLDLFALLGVAHHYNNTHQIETDSALALALAEINPQNLYFKEKAISTLIHEIFNNLVEHGTTEQKAAIQSFLEISKYLRSFENKNDLDVHTFDDYIFGTQKKINDLIKFGNYLQIDNPSLTLKQVGDQMSSFIDSHSQLFSNFKYANKAISIETLKGYLTRHFDKMDEEIISICPNANILWSKAWTLALNLYDTDKNETAIQIIFQQMCENYENEGQCIQGRINRGFVGYVSLLTLCGI